MTTQRGEAAQIRAWMQERLPQAWGESTVTVDREEVVVLLPVAAPEQPADAETSDAAARAQAVAGRVARFRDETRDQRIAVAREAEHRFGRKVAWGVVSDGTTTLFTHLAVPVMTRLRQPERLVLDTLVEAGVARSRAHALSWCVRLVGDNAATWLADLRTAMDAVADVRAAGPNPTASQGTPGEDAAAQDGTE